MAQHTILDTEHRDTIVARFESREDAIAHLDAMFRTEIAQGRKREEGSVDSYVTWDADGNVRHAFEVIEERDYSEPAPETNLDTWIPNNDGTSRLSTIALKDVWADTFARWDSKVETHVAVKIANAVRKIIGQELNGETR